MPKVDSETEAEALLAREFSFWRWVLRSGIKQHATWWTWVHVLVGLGLATLVSGKLSEISKSLLLPLASVLVGLTFAWAGNAIALLQTEEIQGVGQEANGNLYRDYVFTYQLAIFLILSVLVVWGLLGLGVVDDSPILYHQREELRIAGRMVVFGSTSLAFRECWQIVVGAQIMLLQRNVIRRNRSTANPSDPPSIGTSTTAPSTSSRATSDDVRR